MGKEYIRLAKFLRDNCLEDARNDLISFLDTKQRLFSGYLGQISGDPASSRELVDGSTSINAYISMTYLLSDLVTAITRYHKMSDYDASTYISGRTPQEFIDDILATFEMTQHVFEKRCDELLNAIKEDEHPELYRELNSEIEKSTRDEAIERSDAYIRAHGNPYKPYFSQVKATESFKPTSSVHTASLFILGKKVEDIGELIRNNPAMAQVIQVGVFRFKGIWVCENNRGLAAASISGVQPVRVSPLIPEQEALNYYTDKLANAERLCKTAEAKQQFLSTLTLEVIGDDAASAKSASSTPGKSTRGRSISSATSNKSRPIGTDGRAVVVPTEWRRALSSSELSDLTTSPDFRSRSGSSFFSTSRAGSSSEDEAELIGLRISDDKHAALIAIKDNIASDDEPLGTIKDLRLVLTIVIPEKKILINNLINALNGKADDTKIPDYVANVRKNIPTISGILSFISHEWPENIRSAFDLPEAPRLMLDSGKMHG